jgi:hypothetical protein
MVLDFIFYFVLGGKFDKNYEWLFFEAFQKLLFHCGKCFELIFVKITAFQKRFLIKMFRIEGSTNRKSFLKI